MGISLPLSRSTIQSDILGRSMLETMVQVLSNPYFFGFKKGAPFNFRCPTGEYIINFSGQPAGLIDAITVVCSDGTCFTAGGPGGVLVINPDCPEGFTSAQVWWSQQNIQALTRILPSCNSSWTMEVGQFSDGFNDRFRSLPFRNALGRHQRL